MRTVNYALGPMVEHYDPDGAYRDRVWFHCRLTVATLPLAEPDERTAGSGRYPSSEESTNA